MRSHAAQSDPAPPAAPSPALLLAQEKLAALRTALQAVRGEAGAAPGRISPGSAADRVPQSGVGYESAPFSDHIRRARQRRARQRHARAASPDSVAAANPPRPSPTTAPPAADTAPDPAYPSIVALFPDLALAMLRRRQSAAGRLWLLLRLLDRSGRGWLTLRQAQAGLTDPAAPLPLCGRRQLRNLFAQGEGIFWQRQSADGEVRIWLRSPARVALALGCDRLSARPVSLPLSRLLEGIGAVRAHFYACFHSARPANGPSAGMARPIARATLRRLSAASPQSQRNYERRSAVKRRANYAVGPRASRAGREEHAWRHGGASFTLQDHQGKQGAPGATYLARQLPNSYAGPHQRLARIRRKRVNRRLTDLLHKGTTGNGERHTASGARRPSRLPGEGRRYFQDGKRSAHAAQSGSQSACHWPGGLASHSGIFWHTLEGHTDTG